MTSEGLGASRQPTAQVTTTTLLNAVHNIYLSAQPYHLDAGTSLVVNTWLTATQLGPDGKVGGTVDAALAARAWEHARRRAEDGCIILGYVEAARDTARARIADMTGIALYTHQHLLSSDRFSNLSRSRRHPPCTQPSMLSNHSFAV
jgi:hypothetical protein